MKWFKYDIRDLTETEYEKWYSLMSRKKQNRGERFRYMEDKKRTVAGEMLARKAIAEKCGLLEENICFGESIYGKPFAVSQDIEFSISHSGNMVVCAINDKPIGIDIEKIRTMDLDVVRYICTEEELYFILEDSWNKSAFTKISDTAVLTRFLKIWTMKEAYVKCMGGKIADLQNLDVLNLTGQKQTFTLKNYIVSICQEVDG